MMRQLGVSEDTLNQRRTNYGGMCGDQLRRLEELEKENEWLRREVFELMLDKQTLTEMIGKLLNSSRSRHCINHVRVQFTIAEQRFCARRTGSRV